MIATGPFVALTKQVGAHLGFPDVRIITIGHPLGASDEATVRGFADAVVDQAIAVLVGDDVVDVVAPAPTPQPPADAEGPTADHPGVVQIRSLLQADGGDVVTESIADGVVRLRLELRDASCADCVLPRATLEAMSLNILKQLDASITAVHIDDPREH